MSRGDLTRRRRSWRLQSAVTFVATMAPSVPVALSLGGVPTGLGTLGWAAVWLGILAVHALELVWALPALREYYRRNGLVFDRAAAAGAVWRTISRGYPAWLPYKRGVFDRGATDD